MTKTRKGFSRVLSVTMCLIALIFIAGAGMEPLKASALSDGIVTIGEGDSYVTWGGFKKGAKYTFTFNPQYMFYTDYKEYNPNAESYKFHVKANVANQRTGYVYAKQNGNTVAKLKVIQDAHTTCIWTDWQVVKAATCGADGMKTRSCTICGKTESAVIPATGMHSWDSWITEKKATCTTDGLQSRTCRKCLEKQYQTIKATGHSFGKWETTTQPTCTVSGVKKRYCSRCKASETGKINPIGHNIQQVTQNVDCSHDGKKIWKCTRSGCSYVQREEITETAYGHVYKEFVRYPKPNTKSKLEVTLECQRCGNRCVCSDTSRPVKSGSDIILCYERLVGSYDGPEEGHLSCPHYDEGPDGFNAFWSVSEDLLRYKQLKKNGNQGHDTYLFNYTSYSEYAGIWNYFIPDGARFIYDYGHGEPGSHEFYGESIKIHNLMYNLEIPSGSEALKCKHNIGAVYMLTCHAGDIEPYDNLHVYTANIPVVLGANLDKAKMTEVFQKFDGQFSVLRYFATICPNAAVYGVKDTYIDYDFWYYLYWGMDNREHVLTLPSCSEQNLLSGKFVKEYYDANQKKFIPTVYYGRYIGSTPFLN